MGKTTEVRAKAELKVSFSHVIPAKKKGEKTRGSGVKGSGKVIRYIQIEPLESEVLKERIKAAESILKNGAGKGLSKSEKAKIVKKITVDLKAELDDAHKDAIDVLTQNHEEEIVKLKDEITRLTTPPEGGPTEIIEEEVVEEEIISTPSVIAKFECTYNEQLESDEEHNEVNLTAVIEGSEENKSFSKFTPAANVYMVISKETPAHEFFEKGVEYFASFTKAEKKK